MKQLSIIIVNYKSWMPLSKNLDALSEILKNQPSFEVIVIDNCSGDNELANFQTKYPVIDFYENAGNLGFASGCNFGASKAKGDVLLFLNPDTIGSEDALTKMLHRILVDSQIGIVSCKQSEKASSYQKMFPSLATLFGPQRSLYKMLNSEKFKAMNCATCNCAEVSPDWISGSVVMMTRTWFDKVGGWTEDYWLYSEDTDLSKKVANAHGKIILLCDTYIKHDHGGASRINVKTEALTKAEVIASQHVYIQNHFAGFEKSLAHTLLLMNTLVFKGILAIFGLVFFFIPKLRVQLFLFKNCVGYYLSALKSQTWLSVRSPNYGK